MAELPDAIRTEVDAAFDEMVDVRRHLHQHPELGFEEVETTAVIRRRLTELQLDEQPLTTTGAAFRLAGGRRGRPVVLRADIDALPIVERVEVPYTSSIEGRMHACGHDAHTAALLGVARVLQRLAPELPGSYTFLFQPAEELIDGANRMVADGVLEGLEGGAVVGHHVTSLVPAGVIGVRSGIAMAEVHTFLIAMRGSGGHGAMIQTGTDVVRAIADAVLGLHSVVAELKYEEVPCVCSAGVVSAGSAPNVVPDLAVLRGTLRTFTAGQRQEGLQRLEALCRRLGDEHGVSVELAVTGRAPAVVNDPTVTAVTERVTRRQLGSDRVITLPPIAPSDDVSVFLERLPGCFFFVGAGRTDGTSGIHHSPTFAIDEEALRIAARAMAETAVSLAGVAPGN